MLTRAQEKSILAAAMIANGIPMTHAAGILRVPTSTLYHYGVKANPEATSQLRAENTAKHAFANTQYHALDVGLTHWHFGKGNAS